MPASISSEPQAAAISSAGAEGIVAAGDGDGRKWQRIARIGAEGHQMFRPDIRIGDIRRCDEKRACNFPADFRNGVDDGRHTQRMGDENDGLGRGVDLFHEPRHPIVPHRFCPLRLLDTARGGKLALPAGLPVVWAGIGVTRYDEDICF